MSRIVLGGALALAGVLLLIGWAVYYFRDSRLGVPAQVNQRDWDRVTHIDRGFQKKKGRVS